MVSVWPTQIIHLWEKLWVGISLAVAASSQLHSFPGAFSPQLESGALTKSTCVPQSLCKHMHSKFGTSGIPPT